MRLTSPTGLAVRALVATGINLVIFVLSGVCLIGGLSLFIGSIPPLYLLDWRAIGLVGGILGLLVVLWGIPRTIRKERRGLLENSTPIGDAELSDSESVEVVARRLASQFDVPTPELRVQSTDILLAYTTYRPVDPLFRTGRVTTPVIVISTGLVGTVSAAELEAVLAHELAHIVNDDLRLITYILVPLMIADLLYEGDSLSDRRDIVGYLLATIAALGVGVFSRGREVAADRAAAVATSNPAQLVAALERLDESASQRPTEDLRNHAQLTNAVNFVPVLGSARRAGSLWSTHPSIDTRIAELRSLMNEEG